jgi:sialate O-acetylesterase
MQPCPPGFFIDWQPMGLYNGMIAPALRMALKGVLFYQGESNDKNPQEYAALIKTMVQCWRDTSQNVSPKTSPQGGCLPFISAQLPLFEIPTDNNETDTWPLVREAQEAILDLPCTALAPMLDTGEWNDLHPLDKRSVGERLADAAWQLLFAAAAAGAQPAADTAGRCSASICLGPRLRSIAPPGKAHGAFPGTLRLVFDNVAAGLRVQAPPAASGIGAADNGAASTGVLATDVPYVTVKTNAGAMHKAPAKIIAPNGGVADTLEVSLDNIPGEPVAVLYAFANNPVDCFFYNSNGIPMLPFRREFQMPGQM